MKEGCSSSLDRISNLPSHISQIILVSLPLRDMARTAILSKGWRYQWLKVPQLVFKDDPKYLISLEEKYRYTAMKVIEILLLHHGPISKFSLDMTAWTNCSVIDRIIPFLSRNGIQELTLLMSDEGGKSFKLPSSILSCVELRHLSLSSCVLQPLAIVGFSKLLSLELLKVQLYWEVSISSCPLLESLKLHILDTVPLFSIDAPNLKILYFKGYISRIGIMNTPLLKAFSFNGGFVGNNSSSDLISLLLSLPHLENLYLTYRVFFFKGLAVADAPDKLPKLLINLRMLELYVELFHMDQLMSTLWFLRSFPNLQKLKLRLWGPNESQVEAAELYLKMQDHSKYLLLKLQDVEMIFCTISHGIRFPIEFSKFLLDVSPVLGTIYIESNWKRIDVNGYKMLIDLACYPRASPKATIVYVGL